MCRASRAAPLLRLLCAGCVLLVCACTPRHPEQREAPAPGAAVLEGVVRLSPGMAVPAYGKEDLGWDSLLEGERGDSGCAPLQRQEVLTLGSGRTLGGVVVAAAGFTGKHLHPRQTREVVFERCGLHPSIVSATRGDLLRVLNRGPGEVPLSYGPAAKPTTLGEGAHFQLPLSPGIESVMCPRELGCGRSDVVVFHHSIHAVTDAAGRFRIEGFPSGEPVALHAWHPLLDETTTQVWLEQGAQQQVELVFRPPSND